MLSKKHIAKILLDFFETVFIAAGVFIFVYFFVAQLLRITGDSMIPTFKDSEQIIAEKLSIKVKPLKRGDVIVFKHPQNEQRLLIKRVIGLPGETIKFTDGDVYINNSLLTEQYIINSNKTLGEKIMKPDTDYTIPTNSYVVFGDNREFSSDSREFGPVKKDLIVGRVMLVYYPFSSFRFI